MEDYTFDCKVTNYSIQFLVDKQAKTSWMNRVNTDYRYPNAFLMLVRSSIEKLEGLGVLKIRQFVIKEEWDEFLEDKTTWRIVTSNNNILELECPIGDFLMNYGVGIGLAE